MEIKTDHWLSTPKDRNLIGWMVAPECKSQHPKARLRIASREDCQLTHAPESDPLAVVRKSWKEDVRHDGVGLEDDADEGRCPCGG